MAESTGAAKSKTVAEVEEVDVNKVIENGQKLGLKGDGLKSYVESETARLQKALENKLARQERARMRFLEKAKAEGLEKERALREVELQNEKVRLELELKKVEIDRMRMENREEEEKKEKELLRMKLEKEERENKLKLEQEERKREQEERKEKELLKMKLEEEERREKELLKMKLEKEEREAKIKREDDERKEKEMLQMRLEKEEREAKMRLEKEEREAQMRFEKEEREAQMRFEKEEKREKELLRMQLEKEERENKLRLEQDLEMKKLELEVEKAKVESKNSNSGAKDPRLPYFDEHKDKMDSYLARFEKYANANKWQKDRWALNLSALLRGKALEVYDRLSDEDASNWDVLKEALLKNFDLTEVGFRRKFKSSRPEVSETFLQFESRIRSYLEKWISLGKVEQTYQGLIDFLVRDQLLECCSKDLYTYLKPRETKSAREMAVDADRYAEARGGVRLVIKHEKSFSDQKGQHKSFGGSYGSKKCAKCGGNHNTSDCRRKEVNAVVEGETSQKSEASSLSQGQVSQGFQGQNRGRGFGSFGNRGRSRGRGRGFQGQGRGRGGPKSKSPEKKNEVSFCKTTLVNESLGGCEPMVKPEVSDNSHVGVCYFLKSRVPTAQGLLNGKPVLVMRDTGCTGIVVKRSLIDDKDLSDKETVVTLIDSSERSQPTAMVKIDCPFFKGTAEAFCIEDSLYDVVIGNVDGSILPDMTHFAQAVETRSQSKQKEKVYPKLKVPSQISEVNRDEVKKGQEEDDTLEQIRKLVKSGEKRVCRGKNRGEVKFVKKNGLVYREYVYDKKKHQQLVVPKLLREKVMKLAHESLLAGHLGSKKTGDRVMAEFYWPGMIGDVTRYCRSCDICQRTIPKGKVPRVPLGKMPMVDIPFRRVAVDIVGPIEPRSDMKNKYILTMIDYATRYPEAVALPDITTERVAEALVQMFSRVGVPEEMLTDCGSQFTSEVMKEVSRLLSLQQLTTTPYHPICNGLVEKFNGTLKTMLKRMTSERTKDWDKYLPAVLFAIREVPQESLGFSPFELLYGRNVRGPMSILRELWSEEVKDDQTKTTYQYVIDLRERLERTCKVAQENLGKASKRYKRYYDRRAQKRKFKVGDKVLVLLPTSKNKLLVQWKGPYEVTRVMNAMDYEIQVKGVHKTFHANMLKLYVERQSHCLTTVEIGMGDGEIEVEQDEMSFPLEATQTFRDISLCPDLTEKQVSELNKLTEEYSDIFTDIPGRTDQGSHDVELTSTEPVRSENYPIPFATKDVIDKEVNEMLKLGVIEPSKSPYCSPIVLIAKKGDSKAVRFCIDYRKINKISVFDAEPMPNMEEVFAKMAGHKFYSRFDLTKGYWQVPLSDKAKPLTAFKTSKGLYQFTVTPFGMSNSGASFCRMMRKVLLGLENIDNFVDDIWVFTKSWELHLDTLRQLFGRIRKAKLTMKPSKCFIGYPGTECLGHEIQDQALKPKSDKVKVIKEAPVPTTKKQVRSFLGLMGFYRRFIPNFSEIAYPLTELTKKGQPNKIQNWQESHDKAFKELKEKIINPPILKLPQINEPFIIRTDASDIGLGSVLLQEENGEKFPVAYASRKLLPRERNYSVIERECLAIVWGIEKFHRYVYGTEFKLETDHKPLSYLQTAKVLNPRIMRWALKLQPYRFRIVSIKGEENVGADYLSRISADV